MCNFNFELPVDPIPLMEMVKQQIEENGGTVTGEIPNISVSMRTPIGPVAGTCRLVEGSTINLRITKKPEGMSCTMVRNKLVYLITEAVKWYSMQPEARRSLKYLV